MKSRALFVLGTLVILIASSNFLLGVNHEETASQLSNNTIKVLESKKIIEQSRTKIEVTASQLSKNTSKVLESKKIIGHSRSKILGFADYKYREYALRWYHRLSDLGYSEQVIVAVDDAAVDFFRKHRPKIKWEELPYKPCTTRNEDSRIYRRQIFGRRWKYVYDQLLNGYCVLISDVDNVYTKYIPMSEMEESEYDVFHAYSTSYPTDVFEEMGFTVCGGMSWLRSNNKVKRFVRSLVNRCNCLSPVTSVQFCKKCYCDDQIALNEMLWKGKHKVHWDREISKPANLSDFPWHGITGVSSKTKHRIKVWNRSFAYRAKMPNECPIDNWVAMPLYVHRSDVVQVWLTLCSDQV